MNRREFAGLAGLAAVSPREAFGNVLVQDADSRIVTYPEFAIRLGETFHSVSARTSLQPVARGVSEFLLDSAAAVVSGNAEEAREALSRFDNEAQDLLPDLSKLADDRGVTDFEELIRSGVDLSQQDVSRFEETNEIIVDRISLSQMRCLAFTPLAFQPCLGPLWKKSLKCAFVSLPMARLGAYGYAGAVVACLFEDLIDVAIDVIVDCSPDFYVRVGKCFD